MTMCPYQRWWMPVAIVAVATVSAVGQITLDGTVGPTPPLTGPNYSIPDTVGRTVGNNLFHSFGQFNLSQGEKATFTGPEGIANVIARVTGGQLSQIEGTLECTIPGANFFLINPFGIRFGPRAQINVSGSFVASTAHYIKLADGQRFGAVNPNDSPLSTAPVSAFGFLPDVLIKSIAINGPAVEETPPPVVTVGEGKTMAFIGGDITVRNVQLSAVDGRLALLSVASAGELAFDTENLSGTADLSAFAALGRIAVTGSASLDVSGNRGGRMIMAGNDINFTGESELYSVYVAAFGYDVGNGLGLDFTARNAITIEKANLYCFAFADGHGGDVRLRAPYIQIGHGSLGAGTFGLGRAGDIIITADQLQLVNSSGLFSTTAGPGDAGNIQIIANTVRLDSASINTQSFPDTGRAGNISITADTLTLNNSAAISSSTSDAFAGGEITLQVTTLTIAQNSRVEALAYADGQAGNINITAGTILLDDTDTTAVFQRGITTSTLGVGSAGNIAITTGSLELRNGARINSSSEGAATGDSGNITIAATTVKLSDKSLIASSAAGAGKGGGVTIHAADNVVIQGKSQVSVSSAFNDGGDVLISAGQTIQLDQGIISAKADGNGGNITLTTPRLVYLLNSQITAESVQGNGGNITIDPQFVILNHSLLVASAIEGNGGNVTIVADHYLNSESTIDVSSEFGLVGTVAIIAPNLDLSGQVEVLPADLLDAEALLQPHCGMRLPGGASSFLVRGRGGRPIEPAMLLPVIPSVSEDHAK